jgi:hypothetical protein
MDVPMHYPEDQTMIKGTKTTPTSSVLPEHMFARAMTVVTHQHHQDEDILKPWIDPHQLKCIITRGTRR